MQPAAISVKNYSISLSIMLLLLLTTLLVTGVYGAETTSEPSSVTSLHPLPSELDNFSVESMPIGAMPTDGVAASQYKTAPGDLPSFTVTEGEGETGEGYIFMAYYNYWMLEQSAYLLILEDDGQPVFYKQLAPIPIAMDFKKQNNGQLTYFPLYADGSFLALDNSYELVGTYEAGNGYATDLHELQLLDNGNALLMVHDERIVDMSQLVEGGNPKAIVTGCIIQEIDSAKNVVFEWQSWDHISILDSSQPLTDRRFSYIHCNSIEPDLDGNILIASRHLDEITKIDRQTGAIIWRMGGKQNEFQFLNDQGFNYPHDVRRLPNGNITIFDNGVAYLPPFSRGVEYAVDEINKTVMRVQEIRDNPDLYARAMGNMQRLPSGNTVVGWGRSLNVPVFTEFDDSGQKILEFRSAAGNGSYRVFRFPWKGYPTWPSVLQADVHDGLVKLYFSWNGSTETAAYQIFGGKNRYQLKLLATVAKEGFETTYEIPASEKGLWYFQAVPLDQKGVAGQESNIVPVGVGVGPVFLPVTLGSYE